MTKSLTQYYEEEKKRIIEKYIQTSPFSRKKIAKVVKKTMEI